MCKWLTQSKDSVLAGSPHSSGRLWWPWGPWASEGWACSLRSTYTTVPYLRGASVEVRWGGRHGRPACCPPKEGRRTVCCSLTRRHFRLGFARSAESRAGHFASTGCRSGRRPSWKSWRRPSHGSSPPLPSERRQRCWHPAWPYWPLGRWFHGELFPRRWPCASGCTFCGWLEWSARLCLDLRSISASGHYRQTKTGEKKRKIKSTLNFNSENND